MFPIMGWPYCHGATHIFNLFTIIYSEATKMDDLMKPFVRDGTSNASQFVHTHHRDIGRMVAFLPQDPGVKERVLNVLTTCFSQASFARAASSSSRFLSLESSSSIQLVSVW